MKYIKTYENNKSPQIGDYVIFNSINFEGRFKNFLDSNIGEIINVVVGNSIYPYIINFGKNAPSEYENLAFSNDDLFFWGTDLEKVKKEHKIKITANKFNI